MATGLDAQHKIFASNPDDRRAFEALEEHFFLEGSWDALVGLYRSRIGAPSVEADDALRVPLLFRLGQILEERVLDLDGATDVYWVLARIDTTNRPALRQLRGIHERRAQWEMVLQIAELESATTMPPYERAAFESELGRTWQNHLGDPDEARACFERALDADPEFPAALEGLAELHQKAERWDDAAEILERLTKRLRGPERAPAWIALGRLYAGPLEEPERARQCFNAALDDDPFQAPAVEWSLLLATADEDWPVVSELLESRFDLASGARHRAAIAVEASQIQLNHLDSPARARAWVDRAMDLGAEEPAVLLAASDVERSDGDRDALLQTLDKLITITGKNAPRVALVEAAELHADLGDADAALDAIRRAADRSGPGDERILTIQARLLREAGSKRELAEVLETLCALDPGGDLSNRAGQLRELAELQESDLGDDASASANWQRAFDLQPGNVDSLTALDRIYRKSDDWEALKAVLESALSAASGAATADLSARLGELLLHRFDELDRARSLFESALRVDETCLSALVCLREIADQSDDPDLLMDVCEREAKSCADAAQMSALVHTVMPILEERAEGEEALRWATRWTALAADSVEAHALRAKIEAQLERPEAELESWRALSRLQSGRERSHALERQATLHFELGQDLEASRALEQALESSPDSLDLLGALCDVYRRLDRPQELVHALRRLVDQLPPSDQADPLEELASVLQDPLGDLDTAIVVRWKLVDLPDGPAEATRKLESLLEMAGRYAELANLLDAERQRIGDESPEAFALDMRRGSLLLDSLGHCEEAAEIFASLHGRHPDSEEILSLLERALRSGDDAAGLASLLERQAEWESDDDRKAEIQLERAMLFEEALGESHVACDLFEAIIENHADSSSAEIADRRLEGLLESTAQWDRLRSRLTDRADALPEADQVTLREQLATLCRDRLHDIAGCAEQLEIIARIATDRIHVWQQLEEIYARELDRPADWLRVVSAELEAEPGLSREFMLRVGAARLCLDEARRPEGHEASEAYAHYERVLELDPGHAEAAEVLAMHFAKEGRHDETARILEARLSSVEESESAEASDLRLRLGSLYANSLEDDAAARTHFEQAEQRLGPISSTADPLAEIFVRAQDHEALGQLAHKVLESGSAEHQSLTWRMHLAASELALGRLDEAAIAYRAALTESPDDREIEDALIEIYERVDETEPLTELLEKRLIYASLDEALELRMRLARLHADGRDEPEEALSHLEWILDANPQHRDAFERALELAERIQDPARILTLLNRSLDTPLPQSDRAEILEKRAHLLADRLERPEQAVLSFRESLAIAPNRETARAALRTQLERLERWPAVLDCLFVEAMASDEDRRLALFEEAAELAWSRVGPDASLPWLARLRDARPDDPELYARLAEVHRRAGRFEAALSSLDDELALRETDAERCDLFLQSARLLERELHSPARAIQAYRDALAVSEEPAEILAELDRLYDLMGRPSERAEILEARIEARAEDDCLELRRILATLFCVELAKPERAIPHLSANAEAFRGEPQDEISALGALDAALRASGRHDAWVAVAERELEVIEGDPTLADTTPKEFKRYLREELARTYDSLLGNADRALEHLRQLCSEGDQANTELGEQLRDLLRRTGRRAELTTELGHLVAGGGGDPSTWLELARLREEVMLDLGGALEAYREAEIDSDLRLQSLRGQRRCSERLRDWQGLANALEAEYGLENQLGREERATLARRLGDVYWQRLCLAEEAIRGYELALEVDAKDMLALQALTRVHETRDNWDEVVALHRRELSILGEDPDAHTRVRDLWLRIAELSDEVRRRPEEAIEAYRAAQEMERLAPSGERKLAELFESTNEATAFSETFGSWCDRDDGDAEVEDHLRLANFLVSLDDATGARARCERATAVAPESASAWALLGTLDRDAERFEASATAFERAAEHAAPAEAATHLTAAAECIRELDPERAFDLLNRAIDFDPGALESHAALARVANDLDRPEETQRAAERSVELAGAAPLDEASMLEVSVLGGRAAKKRDQRDVVRRLFQNALTIDPDQPEALEGVGLSYFEERDYRSAREPLERRIDLPGENPDRALHLAIIGRGLEAADHLDAAWARYEEALELGPDLEIAHEGVARVHERAARPAEALEALERWSEASEGPVRALASLRAAEHALSLDDRERAVLQLQRATEADDQLTPAWVMLCEVMAESGTESELRDVCNRALEAIEPSESAATISLRAARLAEIAGDNEEARTRYADAAQWDPRASEAALCESRLARMAGDWNEADGVLSRFLERHPDAESPSLAHVHLERGRLLSGPLEEFEQAIMAYESALALQPQMGVARTALASLLIHAPGRWRDALSLHREILEASPTTANSLRAICQIAEQRGKQEILEGALAVLRALGLASPQEEPAAPALLQFAIHPGPPMAEADGERLRKLAHQVSEELGGVLAGKVTPLPTRDDAEITRAIGQIAAIEDELSAPGLARLDAEERAALFSTLAALFLDPGGNGMSSRFRAELEENLGRWTRRKARRIVEETTVAEIESIDHQAWGDELRAMAAAQSIDRNGGDLRGVLRALLVLEASDSEQPAFEGAELGTLASTSETVRRLLARITTLLCERLDRNQ